MRPHRPLLRGAMAAVATSLLAAASACELQEVTVVEIEDVLVAEAYAMVGVPGPEFGIENRLWLFLGRTVGLPDDPALRRATVEVVRSDGARFVLERAPRDQCVSDPARERPGVCYDAGVFALALRPGDALTLTARLPDGRTLTGQTRIPGDFALDIPGPECLLPPDTPFELRWTASEGARAYAAETRIDGLTEPLAAEGVAAPDELYLLGLSISESDTTIVFPGEFGVFDRFDLDQALTVRLQRGLPDQTQAVVGVTASDRNYVNWARGGNFNPSGQIRVPSIEGDGTGVFGSVVLRSFAVFVDSNPGVDGGLLPPCPGGA